MDQNNDILFALDMFRQIGKTVAENLEQKSSSMTQDELHSQSAFFPKFNPEKQYLNYQTGFICISDSGNVVKLLQPYDSTIYTDQPEQLPAQWGFVWPTNPKYAKPFIAVSTSPYSDGDCCTYNGRVYKSGMNNNVWPPDTPGISWEDLGPIEEF